MTGRRPSATLLNVEYRIPRALLKKTRQSSLEMSSTDLLVLNRNIRTAFLEVQVVLFSRRHLATKTATFAAMLHISDGFQKSSRWRFCLLLLFVLAVMLLIIVLCSILHMTFSYSTHVRSDEVDFRVLTWTTWITWMSTILV